MLNENLNQDNQSPSNTTGNPSSNFIFEFNPNENIKIINTKHYHKLKEFQNNPEKFMIVTDFDFTLTKNFSAGERLFSCINALTFSSYISQEAKDISHQLHLKYSIYEYDTTIDFELKDLLMRTWFKETLELITKEKLLKEDFMNLKQPKKI